MKLYLAKIICVLGVMTAGFATATDYKVDGAHSTVGFRAKHLGASYFHGQFAKVSGTLSFDGAKPEGSSIEISVDSASVVTFNQARDNHLKGPDFFNAKEFPAITFKSTSWKKTGEGVYEVTGDLMLLGKTKSITATAEYVGTGKDRRGRELIGFETVFTIDRTDFGMKYGVAPDGSGIGKDIRMTVSVEAAK